MNESSRAQDGCELDVGRLMFAPAYSSRLPSVRNWKPYGPSSMALAPCSLTAGELGDALRPPTPEAAAGDVPTGDELAVGKPEVLFKMIDGVQCEPMEALTVDVEEGHQGGVMQALGERRGELTNMENDGRGRARVEYRIPARGLIGFQNEFMNLTRGTGLISHIFDGYAPHRGDIPGRRNGVLISQDDGNAVGYALFSLQERGRLFVAPGDIVYEGMLVGIHSRDNDLVVNPIKEKKLTNVRSAGKDENILLTPPVKLTLEYAVEFIEDDELVEVTPKSIRLRKRFLVEHERKAAARRAEAAAVAV